MIYDARQGSTAAHPNKQMSDEGGSGRRQVRRESDDINYHNDDINYRGREWAAAGAAGVGRC